MQYKKEEVRNRIIKAAIREFSAAGFYRARMINISRKSKVPIGNLYKYFPSKESLYAALVEQANQQAKALADFFFSRRDVSRSKDALREELKLAAFAMVEFTSEFRTEILLLMESSYGSNYEGFSEAMTKSVAICLPINNDTPADQLVTNVLAKAFVEALLVLNKQCPKEELYSQICHTLMFFFLPSKVDFTKEIELPADQEAIDRINEILEKNVNKK